MSNDKAAPKFIKPGDDPELDRLLAEARAKGSEPPAEHYYDVFGRRRRVPVVDQDAPTLVPNDRSEKGAPTGPVVTETRPATALPKKQRLWLAFGALAITGPVAALALGAFHPPKVPQAMMIAPPSAASAASAAPPVASGTAAPRVPAVPVIEEDAGAAPGVTAAPSGARPEPSAPGAKLGPKGTKPRVSDDPYNEPPKKPPVLVY